MPTGTTLFVWSFLAHLIADWLLQTEWMVQHKTNLGHPAAWVHGGIHALVLGFVLPGWLALLIGVIHMLIDTRKPVRCWKRLTGKTAADPQAVLPQTIMVELWVDQVMHTSVLAAFILFLYGW